MHQVSNKSHHFGIGFNLLQSNRFQVVDFSVSPYVMTVNFMTPKPRRLPQYYNITKPFDVVVWIALGFSIILMVAMGFLLEKWNKTISMEQDPPITCLSVIAMFLGECKCMHL